MTQTLPIDLPSPRAAASPDPSHGRWWVRWAVLLGIWGTFAAIEISQTRYHFSIYDPQYGWGEATVRNLPHWALWMLFTPLIFWAAGRWRVERGTLRRTLPVHLALAVSLAVLHAVLFVGVALWAGWPFHYHATVWAFFQKIVSGKVGIHLFTYAAIAGVFYALDYYRRFRENEVAASQLQARLAEAQLQALRTQIHPHFLFNTLNAISVLCLKGETQCAIRMLSRLSDLLRVTLESDGAQEIPLRQELDFLGRYLDIEKVRFKDRLAVEIDAPEETLSASVPQLLTQPLVENAIRHGIAERVGAGRIEVRAAREGDRLRIEVRDTGPGLPPGGIVREGIGLSNTRARLARLYGGDHRFEIADAPGGGTLVIVELPVRAPELARAVSAPSSPASAPAVPQPRMAAV